MEPSHTFTVLEVIITSLASLIVLLFGVQITQIMNLRKAVGQVQRELAVHILEITQTLNRKVETEQCVTTRQECMRLNKTIIQTPLEKEISDLNLRLENRHTQNLKNYDLFWAAIKKHTHTKIEDNDTDKVIFNNGSG